MSEWKRICCAVDFSEPSRLAMEEAADLCRRCGAELTLVHVQALPPAVEAARAALGEPGQAASEEGDRVLAGWRARAEEKLERPVLSALLAGSPASEIVEYARAHPIDLLVVATRGRTGLSRILLGSVAERVVREAPCPVLVVRRREERLADDPEEVAQYRG